jgi:hypothetical protein
MSYMEYMVMLGYKVEQELLDKKINKQYRLNQQADAEERPNRHRPARFWWHYNPNKPDQKK